MGSNRTTLQTWIYRVFSHVNWSIKTRHSHSLCSNASFIFNFLFCVLQDKAKGWTNINLLYFPDSIEITSRDGLTLWYLEINQSKQPLADDAQSLLCCRHYLCLTCSYRDNPFFSLNVTSETSSKTYPKTEKKKQDREDFYVLGSKHSLIKAMHHLVNSQCQVSLFPSSVSDFIHMITRSSARLHGLPSVKVAKMLTNSSSNIVL